jgi:hypothetical protein
MDETNRPMPELKVLSFMTSVKDEKLDGIHGGYDITYDPLCWIFLTRLDLCVTETACSTTDDYGQTHCNC